MKEKTEIDEGNNREKRGKTKEKEEIKAKRQGQKRQGQKRQGQERQGTGTCSLSIS